MACKLKDGTNTRRAGGMAPTDTRQNPEIRTTSHYQPHTSGTERQMGRGQVDDGVEIFPGLCMVCWGNMPGESREKLARDGKDRR